VVLPVRHDQMLLGALAVWTPPGVELVPAERRLVGQLAGHAGMLVANALLTRSLMDQVDAVRARRRELASSRRAVVLAQDAERRRLERDLHDGAQQELVAVLVHVSTMAALLRSGRPLDRAMVAPAAELLDASAETVAGLARGGAPPVLAEHGLAGALRQAADRAAVGGALVDFRCRLAHEPEPWAAAVVYFTCAEALQNAAKHAHARRIEVQVALDGDELGFSVSDDGVGFDGRQVTGTGVEGMGRRVTDAGGVAELTSSPGAGTRLVCRLPVAVRSGELRRETA
jgi:signal transduction histidine kinase